MNKISINNFSDVEIEILNKLNEYGKGYIVGGAIRDILLGLKPKDVDFATNLPYGILKTLFSEYTPKETGKSFGVLRIRINNIDYEIAKFRKDIYGKEKKVSFVDDIRNDLARRDFTINAMAYNEVEGIVDLYNGEKDIENKVINFIGNAEERIIEDPLRVLRAFRFMSRLNFSLSENTIEAIKNQKFLLKNIPEERITMEFSKLLLGDNIKNTLTLMKDTGVLELIIPEFKATYDFNQCNPHHNLDLFNHIINVVSKVPADLELRYSALLHDIAKPIVQTFDEEGIAHYKTHEIVGADMARDILTRMKLPVKLTDTVEEIIKKHMVLYKDITDKKFNKLLSEMGYDNLWRLIEHCIADNSSKNDEVVSTENDLHERLKRAVEKQMQVTVNDLAVNGKDLIELGFNGKEIGEIKKELLDKYLSEEIQNNKEEMMKYVKEKYKK
ncbi:CCA tRNA nucleotidyltransferase [Fusobacterium animalis]|uniref:HDIG domain protein n=1 Tax=Fusobacterium nucleatum TaxID=851 RepID=A0A133PBN2_FUSNU|nr:CCA tRNA nucleotidyltransferase [Fusobacterium nucleatum]KXA26017.1 HDIG domain protein [Fusobacterium nucleatum]MCL4576760.1 poly(A) polymerase [Fusobacterium nucleatum YWH7056]MCL4583786.1 poly(A) polymerase [Fusobacterium nucleatum YWH7054]MCL4591624.1 poly(A) polymerase [Fusobacterium nucleatum YWH7053]